MLQPIEPETLTDLETPSAGADVVGVTDSLPTGFDPVRMRADR
jgi:hypothetical protein